jgi:hypothetical protein
MPTYVYEVIEKDGSGGERFELVQPMSDEPITVHPEIDQPVRRVIQPFQITGASSAMKADRVLADDNKLEKLGFTKYVKSGDGKYDRVVGKGGPKSIGG